MKALLANSKKSDPRPRAAIPAEIRIVSLFLLFAGLWVLLSDRIVEWLAPNLRVETELQSIKGLLFVAITGAWLYFMLRRAFKKRERALALAAAARERFELVARASNDA